MMVRDLQSVIGREVRRQLATGCRTCWSPASAGARTRSGLFHPFLGDREVRLIGVEAAGDGLGAAATRRRSPPGIARRPPREPLLPPPGRGRPGPARPLDLRGPRLPRRRPRALLAQGHRPGRVRGGDRRGGARGVRPAGPARGHHPGARVGARRRPRADGSRPPCRARPGSWSACRAAGTRTSTPSAPRGRARGEPAGPPGQPCRALTRRSRALRAAGERALVPYFCAGDPSLEVTRRWWRRRPPAAPT